MKTAEKVQLAAGPLWQGVMGPFRRSGRAASFVLFITGDGKGYGYDLGSEANLYMAIGVIGLAGWLAACVPVTLWLVKNAERYKKGRPPSLLLCFAPLLSSRSYT